MTILFIIPPNLSPSRLTLQFESSKGELKNNEPIVACKTNTTHSEIKKHLTRYPNYAFFFDTKEQCILFKLGAWEAPRLSIIMSADLLKYSLQNHGNKKEHPIIKPARSRFFSRDSITTIEQPQVTENNTNYSKGTLGLHDKGEWLYTSKFSLSPSN